LTLLIALVGYLPLQPFLDPSARWFFPAALVLGLVLERRGRALPPRLLTVLSVLLFVYFAAGFTRDHLIPVTADLLVVFLGIRMLGERSGRHYLQLFALSLFCLAASSLYNLSAVFLVYLLLLLLLLAVSLVVLTFHAHDPELALAWGELKKVLGVAGLLPAAELPILLFLFVLLPRTQYPLWNFLNQPGTGATGFSETVRPGASASVSELKTPVLRAICGRLSEGQLYWRGIVLNGFQGDAWVRLPAPPEHPQLAGTMAPVRQEIYPEPSHTRYLLALNVPQEISGLRASEAGDTVFTGQRPLEKRVKYRALSRPVEAIPVRGGIDRAFYLALPHTVSERMRAEGRALSRPGLSVPDQLMLLERFFRGQRISYATTGLPTGADPLDDFLFGKRRGNCEFFASSCATLLRLAGVPARLVGGYRGGSYNEMGGYYLVTEDLAHVWVEAYQEGRGWLTVDPTTWSVGFARQGGTGKIRMYLDALGFYWNKAVISYDLDKQISLLTSVGSKARNFRFPARLGRSLVLGLLFLLPLGGVLVLCRRRPKSREARLLKSFLRAVGKRYPEVVRGGEGLFELAQSLDDPRVSEFAALYGGALYRDRALNREELARLKETIRLLNQRA